MTTLIAILNQPTTTITDTNTKGVRTGTAQERLLGEMDKGNITLSETSDCLELTLVNANLSYELPKATLAAVGLLALVGEGILNLPRTLTPVAAGYINSFAARMGGADVTPVKQTDVDLLDLEAVTASVIKLPSRADWLKLVADKPDLLELSIDEAGKAKIEASKAAIKAAAAAIDSLKAALKPVLAIKGAKLTYNSGELARVELPLGEVSKVISLAPTLDGLQLVGKPIVADDFSSAMAVFETVPAEGE